MNFKNKTFLVSIGAIILGVISLGLGLASVLKPIGIGHSTGKIFDKINDHWVDTIKTHINVVRALGIIAALIGASISVLGIFGLIKAKADKEFKMSILIVIAVIAVVGLIIGSVAMAFNGDLSDPEWVAKQLLEARK